MTFCEQSGHSITLHVIEKVGISIAMHVLHGCYKLNFVFFTRTLSVLQSQNGGNVYWKEFQKKLKLEMLFHLGREVLW